ncbi:MAG TPA: hypothetical protein VMD79_11705 [Solirubrobacteraceae bacterium]|nr:hypothetical protein [Solirubrobacteraceae bacterium]
MTSPRAGRGRTPALLACVALALAALCASAPRASAAQGPVWRIMAVSNPTNFKPEDTSGDDSLEVMVTNTGNAPSEGTVEIADALPTGITAADTFGSDTYMHPAMSREEEQEAPGNPRDLGVLSCSSTPVPTCTTSEPIDPGDTLLVNIAVDVHTATTPEMDNVVTVSEAGGPSVTATDPIAVSSASPEYGVVPGSLTLSDSTSQAGAHPDVTTSFALNTVNPSGSPFESVPVAPPKDIVTDLPPGLVGSTVGMARCPLNQVIKESDCPTDTMVGTATFLLITKGLRLLYTAPVFNIAPAQGEPAAFAFDAALFSGRLDASVLSSGDYGVRITASEITQGAELLAASFTLWGVPAEHDGPGHDHAARNLRSVGRETATDKEEIVFGGPASDQTETAFTTSPTQCSTPLEASLSTEPWEGPDIDRPASQTTTAPAETGCEQLPLDASASMLPDTLQAGAPAGYVFDLNVPQTNSPHTLAPPDLKQATVTLPAGTVVSPSAASGLGGCSEAQFGLHSGLPAACPRESQIGTVEVKSPALEEPLTGQAFLAAPLCNPCSPADAQEGRMLRMYVQLLDEGEQPLIVKLEGRTQLNQQTGQITVAFDESPQLPFSDFKLTLTGGERAPLANPSTCGVATTSIHLTPWSSPFAPNTDLSSAFEVTGCAAPQFQPSFAAGTADKQAGSFSPFTTSFSRTDRDQDLGTVQITMPPGLLGMLSSVPLCPEPAAAQGTCPAASQIGTTTVASGPGSQPVVLPVPGQPPNPVYLTTGYGGAPFGLSFVVPAIAGPFNLGTVVVRAAISVDPNTAQVSIASEPLPTMLDGIPLQTKSVDVDIDRPGFMLNPTSCEAKEIAGTLTSTNGTPASVSSPFQAASCASLGFAPKLTASTQARTSKLDGASLEVRVTANEGPAANATTPSEANIAKVDTQLPLALPSRDSTLNLACTEAQFALNPAGCPVGSAVGTAVARTPVLSVPLEGPAYLVSHGGAAFPDLDVILQGEGVEIVLTGHTDIKKGITYSRFETLPDAPISSFELRLPEGPDSLLGVDTLAVSDESLCHPIKTVTVRKRVTRRVHGRLERVTKKVKKVEPEQQLVMPTTITAQNGAVLTQSTPITVLGCPKARARKSRKGATVSGKARTRSSTHK